MVALNVAQIHTRKQDPSACNGIQPLQQLHHARFAGAGAAENADGLARRGSKRYVRKHGNAVAVIEAYVIEYNAAVKLWRQRLARLLLCGNAEDFLQALQRDIGLAQIGQNTAQLTHGEREHRGIGGEQQHAAQAERSLYCKPHAAHARKRDLQIADRIRKAPVSAHQGG